MKIWKRKPNDEKIAPLKQGVHTMKLLCGVLGLFQKAPASGGGDDQLVSDLMELILKIRDNARQNKDWATSDTIRDGLTALGITT